MKNEEKNAQERPQPSHALHIKDPQVSAIVNRAPSETDPNGSYTGRPKDPREMPQQDADDL